MANPIPNRNVPKPARSHSTILNNACNSTSSVSPVLFRWGCYSSVGRLAGRRAQKAGAYPQFLPGGGTSLLSTLNLENLRCSFECGYALPRLFSPSFFLANSKLHFYSLLLQKTTFTGLKAKDVYHSHPYLKDII